MKTTPDTAADDACTFVPVSVKKMKRALTAPTVQFVSLVGHAASQISFAMIKNEEGKANNHQTPTMHPKNFGANGTVNRIEFDATIFKSEAAVIAHAKTLGIDAKTINKTDTHYVIPGVNADSLDDVQMVKTDTDGVFFYVGQLKANLSKITPPSPNGKPTGVKVNKSNEPARERDPDEVEGGETGENQEQPSAPLDGSIDEVITKMDSWVARQVGTLSFDETMATGEVELPGFYTISEALQVTVMNIVRKAPAGEIPALITAAYTRAGEVMVRLASLFTSIQKSDDGDLSVLNRDEVMKFVKNESSSPESASADAGVAQNTGDTGKTNADGKGEEEEEQQAPPAANTSVPAPVDTAEVIAKAVKEAVEAAVTPLNEKLTKSEAGKTALENRLVAIESISQIRKSDPGTGEGEDNNPHQSAIELRKAEAIKKEEEEKKKDQEFLVKRRGQSLGII